MKKYKISKIRKKKTKKIKKSKKQKINKPKNQKTKQKNHKNKKTKNKKNYKKNIIKGGAKSINNYKEHDRLIIDLFNKLIKNKDFEFFENLKVYMNELYVFRIENTDITYSGGIFYFNCDKSKIKKIKDAITLKLDRYFYKFKDGYWKQFGFQNNNNNNRYKKISCKEAEYNLESDLFKTIEKILFNKTDDYYLYLIDNNFEYNNFILIRPKPNDLYIICTDSNFNNITVKYNLDNFENLKQYQHIFLLIKEEVKDLFVEELYLSNLSYFPSFIDIKISYEPKEIEIIWFFYNENYKKKDYGDFNSSLFVKELINFCCTQNPPYMLKLDDDSINEEKYLFSVNLEKKILNIL